MTDSLFLISYSLGNPFLTSFTGLLNGYWLEFNAVPIAELPRHPPLCSTYEVMDIAQNYTPISHWPTILCQPKGNFVRF